MSWASYRPSRRRGRVRSGASQCAAGADKPNVEFCLVVNACAPSPAPQQTRFITVHDDAVLCWAPCLAVRYGANIRLGLLQRLSQPASSPFSSARSRSSGGGDSDGDGTVQEAHQSTDSVSPCLARITKLPRRLVSALSSIITAGPAASEEGRRGVSDTRDAPRRLTCKSHRRPLQRTVIAPASTSARGSADSTLESGDR